MPKPQDKMGSFLGPGNVGQPDPFLHAARSPSPTLQPTSLGKACFCCSAAHPQDFGCNKRITHTHQGKACHTAQYLQVCCYALTHKHASCLSLCIKTWHTGFARYSFCFYTAVCLETNGFAWRIMIRREIEQAWYFTSSTNHSPSTNHIIGLSSSQSQYCILYLLTWQINTATLDGIRHFLDVF